MPTVMSVFGLRVVIYPNDHRPAHVHIQGKGCEAVFDLQCPVGPPKLRENYGFGLKDLGKIGDELASHLTQMCAAWRQIHGDG